MDKIKELLEEYKSNYHFQELEQQLNNTYRKEGILLEDLYKFFPIPDTHYYKIENDKIVVDYR
jgi:hypothetical protein